jgi:hypothetical protein
VSPLTGSTKRPVVLSTRRDPVYMTKQIRTGAPHKPISKNSTPHSNQTNTRRQRVRSTPQQQTNTTTLWSAETTMQFCEGGSRSLARPNFGPRGCRLGVVATMLARNRCRRLNSNLSRVNCPKKGSFLDSSYDAIIDIACEFNPQEMSANQRFSDSCASVEGSPTSAAAPRPAPSH